MTQPIAAADRRATLGTEIENGESYGNSGQEGRHDATLRFEGRCAAGDGIEGGALRDYAAQDSDQRRLRIGADWPGRVCEGKETDQGDARTLRQAQPAASEIST